MHAHVIMGLDYGNGYNVQMAGNIVIFGHCKAQFTAPGCHAFEFTANCNGVAALGCANFCFLMAKYPF
jgi:hypothetical protein